MVMATKSIVSACRKLDIYLHAKNIIIFDIHWSIAKFFKVILGTLDIPGHAHQKKKSTCGKLWCLATSKKLTWHLLSLWPCDTLL